MITFATISAGEYQNSLTIPIVDITDGVSLAGLHIECANWTTISSHAVIELQISKDGGETWQNWIKTAIFGGRLDKHGTPIIMASVRGKLPGMSGLKLQGTITITGTLITDGISVIGA